MPPTRQELLDTAKQYVSRDRNTSYGEPEDNFRTIAEFWNTYWERRTSSGATQFNEIDNAIMMALLKIARIANDQGNLDNYIDLAGYAACAGELVPEKPPEARQGPSKISVELVPSAQDSWPYKASQRESEDNG